MQKRNRLVLLVLALFLLLPTTAWAAEVPTTTVTEDGYRFYLEKVLNQKLPATDFSQYSTQELKELLQKAEPDETVYREEMINFLCDNYHCPREVLEADTTEILEKRTAGMYWVQVYVDRAMLEREYDTLLEQEDADTQAVAKWCYQTILKNEYGVTKDLSNYEWYELERMEQYLVLEGYGVTEDLSDKSLEELGQLKWQLDWEKRFQDNYGVTVDLTGYSEEEIQKLEARVEMEYALREEYGVMKDVANYSDEELYRLLEQCFLEEWILEDYGVKKDLSAYTPKELDIVRDWLSTALTLRDNYGVTENLSGYTVAELKQKLHEFEYPIQIVINGEAIAYPNGVGYNVAKYTSDTRPIMQDNRVYIPFRAVFEALGADVSYNASAKTVTAKRDSTTVSFTVGEAQYSKNGVTQQMDANVFVQDGRTFVPVRFAAQALGATVEWDSEDRTVVITE